MSVLGLDISGAVVLIGLFIGLTYGLLAVGLVLVYKATRVINFAYGETGAFGALLCAKLTYDAGVPFVLSLLIALVVGAAIGALTELVVVRRLFHAPRLILLVATIGVAQLVYFGSLSLPEVTGGNTYPTALDRSAPFLGTIVRAQDFLALAVIPAVIAGLSVFLGRTPYGTAIRASADNPEAARLAQIGVKRVSTLVWTLSGALAVLTTVLFAPIANQFVGSGTQTLGPALLLRALAAAMIGRLDSLPRTFFGGVAIGLIEAVCNANFSSNTPGSFPNPTNLIFLVLILGLLLARSRKGSVGDAASGYSLIPKVPSVPDRLRDLWWVRHLNVILSGVGLLLALLVPLIVTRSGQLFPLTLVPIYAMIALSLTVLTGWAGQLSLGQFAFAGAGAFVTGALMDRGMPFAIAALYACVAGVLLALLLGIPALRIHGLFLAIVTLAFAVTAYSVLFQLPGLATTTNGSQVVPGEVLGVNLGEARTYYILCVVALAVVAVGVAHLRNSGIGRQLIAVRDNDRSSAAYTVSVSRAKLTAFAISGGIAAFAGALYGGLRVDFTVANFLPEESLRIVAITIVGGLGTVVGPILGAIYVVGLPYLFGNAPAAQFLSSSVGLLMLLLYFPTGLAGMAYNVRSGLLGRAAARLPESEPPPRPQAVSRTRPVRIAFERDGSAIPVAEPVLEARDITVRFGGRAALDRVSITAMPGEVVGLIGSNGAGKSTLMNVVSGFQRADGQVFLQGVDVTRLSADQRAKAGLGRAFQDARLFGDLTVTECVMVALEAQEASELVPSLIAFGPSRRAEDRKRAEAKELLAFLGLTRYGDSFVSSLSTGTRRIAELACLIALDAKVLLLDEPTAGIAQKEAEVFGPLLKRIQAELDATIVIIEHDMPLVMSVSDRIYCLGAGTVIAQGSPVEVADNPAVIASYLGTDERAIQRSGTPVST